MNRKRKGTSRITEASLSYRISAAAVTGRRHFIIDRVSIYGYAMSAAARAVSWPAGLRIKRKVWLYV